MYYFVFVGKHILTEKVANICATFAKILDYKHFK